MTSLGMNGATYFFSQSCVQSIPANHECYLTSLIDCGRRAGSLLSRRKRRSTRKTSDDLLPGTLISRRSGWFSIFRKEAQRVNWFNAEKTAGFENFTYEGFGELYSYGFLLNRKTAALPQWIHRGDNRRPRGQTDHCTLVLRRIQVASTQGFRKRSL